MNRLILLAVTGLLLAALGACAPTQTDGTTGPESVRSFQSTRVAHPRGEAEAVTVNLTLSFWDTTITALDDADQLIEAAFDYLGEIVFDVTGTVEKEVFIAQDNKNQVYEGEETGRWQIALSPDVTTRLAIEASLGALDADLSALDLEALDLDMSTGDATIRLPARASGIALAFSGSLGDLDLTVPDGTPLSTDDPVKLSTGTTTLHLGEGVAWRAAIAMGIGDLVLDVAPDAAVRVTITRASVGTFDPQIALEQVEVGDEDGTGVWETPGYAEADAPIDLSVEMSIGDLIVQ